MKLVQAIPDMFYEQLPEVQGERSSMITCDVCANWCARDKAKFIASDVTCLMHTAVLLIFIFPLGSKKSVQEQSS